jgi:hypothetical protein
MTVLERTFRIRWFLLTMNDFIERCLVFNWYLLNILNLLSTVQFQINRIFLKYCFLYCYYSDLELEE